jgi:hypothetical protein
MKTVLCSVCILILMGTAMAQTDRGTVTGTVSDPSGAMIGGATVVARNIKTGAEHQAASTATGNYTLASIPAGNYEITVTQTGFKKFVRPEIQVSVAQVVRIDAVLEVGQISETVTVQADTPMLKTESGELSHNISYDRVTNIPVLTLGAATGLGNLRNPLQVVTLLPGSAFANDNTLRVNGMPSSSQAVRIEGQDATNGLWRQQNQSIQAGLDSIQEVTIQTSNFAAEYGQAGGGYFNYTMKSGTNALHGSAYDYFVDDDFHAGLPFTRDPVSGEHIRNTQVRHDYGFTLGGPIFIPKAYNGKDRSFFFFNFEQFRESQTISNGIATMPTDAYRNGDFSAALGPQLTKSGVPVVDPLGRPVFQNEVYNPNTTRTVNGFLVRDPFMGCNGTTMNVICNTPGNPNYYPLDPVAQKMQSLLPAPNVAGSVFNNYNIPAYENFRHTTTYSFKLDHNLSSKIKLSGYFSTINTVSPSANGFTQAFTSAVPVDTHSYTTRFNVDYTIKPTMLFHFGGGLLYTTQPGLTKEVDRNSFGFTNPYFVDVFPQIGGLSGTGQKGGLSINMSYGFPYKLTKDIKPTANASLTWVKGNHTVKSGAEMVLEGVPTWNYSRAGGVYAFDANQTNMPMQEIAGWNSTTGFNYASFLTGRADSLQVAQTSATRLGNHSFGLFVQDTWKVTRKLTLDYGLRYDFASLLKEQYGRMQSADFNKPNSVAGNLPGTMIYEATCNCSFNENYKWAFGPRIGIAYQINSKTVFRAGGGIAYSTSPNNAMLSLSISDFYTYSRQGYGNPAMILKDGNPTPDLVWPDFSNHYPGETAPGVKPPAAPFISIAKNTGRLPRIFQWSIGLQREILPKLVVEAAYVGNRGAWWTAPTLSALNYNGLTPEGLLAQRKYGSTQGIDVSSAADRLLLGTPISSPAVIARFPLLANANNVYPGFPASQPLRQALRDHPQWLGVPPFLGPPMGNTWYDSLQVKVTKRFSHGLDMQAAFTWQKELSLGANSDTSYVTPGPAIINDVYDRRSLKQISSLSRPLMFVLSFNYITPKIQASNSALKVLSLVARDWSLGGVLRYQSGELIRIPASNNNIMAQLARTDNPGNWGGGATLLNRVEGVNPLLVDPNCRCFDPQQQLVLNPAAWAEPGDGKFGTGAPYYDNYRWQRQPSEALSFGRSFPIKEKATISVRMEFQNIFNRVFLSNPIPVSAGLFGASAVGINKDAPTTRNASTGILTGGYGYVNTVSGGAARPRSGQLVARISF